MVAQTFLSVSGRRAEAFLPPEPTRIKAHYCESARGAGMPPLADSRQTRMSAPPQKTDKNVHPTSDDRQECPPHQTYGGRGRIRERCAPDESHGPAPRPVPRVRPAWCVGGPGYATADGMTG